MFLKEKAKEKKAKKILYITNESQNVKKKVTTKRKVQNLPRKKAPKCTQ